MKHIYGGEGNDLSFGAGKPLCVKSDKPKNFMRSENYVAYELALSKISYGKFKVSVKRKERIVQGSLEVKLLS